MRRPCVSELIPPHRNFAPSLSTISRNNPEEENQNKGTKRAGDGEKSGVEGEGSALGSPWHRLEAGQ